MSEKQAKLNRREKNEKTEKVKKDPKKTIETALCIVLVAAVAGLGAYASWNELKGETSAVQTDATETDTAETDTEQTQTVADIAEAEGQTADEFLQKCGLADSGLTGESEASEFYAKLTISGVAMSEDKTAAELKEEYGISDLSDDTLWQEAQLKVPMGVIAKQNGMEFAEFAETNGFPAEITADTTYEDAIKAIQTQQTAE